MESFHHERRTEPIGDGRFQSRINPQYTPASADLLDDMEHHVREAIARYKDAPGFPQLESYGVTEDELDDYLFDKQAVIDTVDDLRKKYTTWGIIFIIHTVIMAFFEQTFKNQMIGLAGGFVFCGIYWLLTKAAKAIRMRRLHNEAIERYLADVMAFNARAEESSQDS